MSVPVFIPAARLPGPVALLGFGAAGACFLIGGLCDRLKKNAKPLAGAGSMIFGSLLLAAAVCAYLATRGETPEPPGDADPAAAFIGDLIAEATQIARSAAQA